MKIPEKELVEQKIKELQQIMRVQDWDITLEIVNDREMDAIAKSDYIPSGYNDRNRSHTPLNRLRLFLIFSSTS